MSISGEFNRLCMIREYGLGITEGIQKVFFQQSPIKKTLFLDDFPFIHFVVNKLEGARDEIHFLILTLDMLLVDAEPAETFC